jgi:signal transduction histidine kinase
MAAKVVEEDSRIATGLADTVIRDLFAAGLRMQGLLPRAGEEVQDELSAVVADLDRVIREIRDVVFGLDPDRGIAERATRAR